MKAKDMYELIKSKIDCCNGLEEWIVTYLSLKFINSGSYAVNVSYSELNRVGWKKTSFINCMRGLGYSVEVRCEDIPCSEPYLVISIPPQGK